MQAISIVKDRANVNIVSFILFANPLLIIIKCFSLLYDIDTFSTLENTSSCINMQYLPNQMKICSHVILPNSINSISDKAVIKNFKRSVLST